MAAVSVKRSIYHKKGKIRNHNETTAPYPTLKQKLSASWKQSLDRKKNT